MTRSKRIALAALVAMAFATAVVRGTPASEAPQQSITRTPWSIDLNYLAVMSDFDGDRRLDQAELHLSGTHHCIRIRFGDTREIHLDLGTRPHSTGVLLVRDANRDNKPDLIWVYRSRSQSAIVWLNDGNGHFAQSSDGNTDATLNLLFGDNDHAQTGTLEDKEVGLAPPRPSSEFAQVLNLDCEYLTAVRNPLRGFRRDLGRYLSHLRERGPP